MTTSDPTLASTAPGTVSDLSRTAQPHPLALHRPERPSLRARFAWWAERYLRIGSYPRGLFLSLLKSRAAPWIGRLLTLALFVCAALPDAGFKVNKYVFIIGLSLLFLLTEWFRTLVVGTGLEAYRRAAASIGVLISDFAGRLSGMGDQVKRTPHEAIGIMLRRGRDFVQTSMQIPEGELISATLLRPHRDAGGTLDGFEEARNDDLHEGRTNRLLPLNLQAISSALEGTASALPHTQQESYFQHNPPPYRSVAYFPVCIGTSDDEAVILALLALESSEPYRFEKRTVLKLEPFISPIAQLIGLALAYEDGHRP